MLRTNLRASTSALPSESSMHSSRISTIYRLLTACGLSGHFPAQQAAKRDGATPIPIGVSGDRNGLVGVVAHAQVDEKSDKERNEICCPVAQLSRLPGTQHLAQNQADVECADMNQ